MKWWTAIIAVVCGAELVVAAAIGGAGIGVFFGLDGAFVAALAAATLAFSVRWRLAGRRRSGPTGARFPAPRILGKSDATDQREVST